MPSLKYRSASGESLAPLSCGFHELDGVQRIMYEFSNQVKVLHNVTPIDLLVQSAVLLVQARRVSGKHVSPPLRLKDTFSTTPVRVVIVNWVAQSGWNCTEHYLKSGVQSGIFNCREPHIFIIG